MTVRTFNFNFFTSTITMWTCCLCYKCTKWRLLLFRNNTHFIREGRNIYVTIPISSVDATLGCEVDVPTVQGDVKVKIPAGTQSGTTLRLKGKGVKDLRGNGYGDQMVKVEVKIPTKLSSKEKSLYEQLQKLSKKESIFESFKKGFKR